MCPNPQFLADLVTLTEEILNGKLHFLSNESSEFVAGYRLFIFSGINYQAT